MNDITIIAGNNPFVVTVFASLLGTLLALCLFGVLRFIVKKLTAAKAQSGKSEKVKPSDASGEADDKQEAASADEPKASDNEPNPSDNEAATPDDSEKADDKESGAQN